MKSRCLSDDVCMTDSPVPLLLIPGFMLDESLWADFVVHLPDDWPLHHADTTSDDTIAAIAARIVSNAPPRFVLIGFSLGGYIARQIAADYPARIIALVLVASSARADTPAQIASKRRTLASLSAHRFSGLSYRSIAETLHPARRRDTLLITRIRGMSRRLGYVVFARQWLLERSGVPSSTIDCPTLVVASKQDEIRPPAETKELAAAIPGAGLLWLDAAGHMLPLEQPEALAEQIVDWLKRLPGLQAETISR